MTRFAWTAPALDRELESARATVALPRRPGCVARFLDPHFAACARRAIVELADAVWPNACALCSARDEGDGLGCGRHRLVLGLPGPRCGRCAAALAPALPDGERCPDCRARAPGWEALTAACVYPGTAGNREWLLAFKHGRRSDLALTLGRALALSWFALQARTPREGRAVFVPVPLHPLRRLERGFDQALLLARAAGACTGVPVARALHRVRMTGVQGAPGSSSRTANVAGAFRPAWPAWRARRRVIERDVWIVDDVVTSGATAAECARVLRGLGSRSVSVLAVARA